MTFRGPQLDACPIVSDDICGLTTIRPELGSTQKGRRSDN